MSERNESSAKCGMGGSVELRVRYDGDGRTIAEVWCFGAFVSVTTLDENGTVTVSETPLA